MVAAATADTAVASAKSSASALRKRGRHAVGQNHCQAPVLRLQAPSPRVVADGPAAAGAGGALQAGD
eukprot:CAMPEP_0170233124 /NCGR_PEP_ID=MMETSP0116_2-20130129/16307_1 /TAXON_ID=400756 /ORGANISM="Durinskia baltica, Strain CSIRO CS-38" /LENGTH=66 /DNA_ID=CAMNT_0010483917 /DNA_START=838 /DNA_END=1036 /DNA_ORIENTATION=-